MSRLQVDEIAFESASMVDDVGRVFYWNGDIYRAIISKYSHFYRELLSSDSIPSLCQAGLSRAEPSPISLDGYELVLKHQRIPFVSYPVEWSSQMLRDAALLICDLSIALYEHNLTLKDAHPWNILFDHGRPIFIDWGSIAPLRPQQQYWPVSEFWAWFVAPLYLMSAGLQRIARLLLTGVPTPPSSSNILRLLLGRLPLRVWLHCWLSSRRLRARHSKASPALFRALRQEVEHVETTSAPTEWTNYRGPSAELFTRPVQEWPPKLQTVHQLVRSLQPATVLDIGSNRGWFAELAAREAAKVIALDIDEASINTLYRHVSAANLPILPLVMDVCTPTPPHGLLHAYSHAYERLQADLVLCLALTHHLVFKRRLTFDAIFKQLSLFTRRWLLVEFVPQEDQYVSKWMNDGFSWYTFDNFLRAARRYFKMTSLFQSSPSPRMLLLCER